VTEAGAAPYIRRARPDDADAIAGVQVASWKTTYRGVVADAYLDAMVLGERPAYWRASLERESDLAFVAEDVETGRIVGFVTGGANRRTEPYAAEFTSELHAIYLLEAHQRGGTGTRLVRALVSELLQRGERSMVVLALEENPSTAFYQQLGARRLGGEPVKIGGAWYPGVAYGWDDLSALGRRLGW
jgi:GNAT superfamily N-acetyltransferase